MFSKRSKSKQHVSDTDSVASWAEETAALPRPPPQLDSDDELEEHDVSFDRMTLDTQLKRYIDSRSKVRSGLQMNLLFFEGTVLAPGRFSYAGYCKMLGQSAVPFAEILNVYKGIDAGAAGLYTWLHRKHYKALSSFQTTQSDYQVWLVLLILLRSMKPETRFEVMEASELAVPLDLAGLEHQPLRKDYPMNLAKVKSLPPSMLAPAAIMAAAMVLCNVIKNNGRGSL